MAKIELDWKNEGYDIAVDTLPAKQAKLYAAYRAKAKEAAVAREAAEDAIAKLLQQTGDCPPGMVPVFSHKFGKLRACNAVESETAPRTKGKVVRFED
jgi:hypothetical protein